MGQLVLHSRATDDEVVIAEGVSMVQQVEIDSSSAYVTAKGSLVAINRQTGESVELVRGLIGRFGQDDRFLYVLLETTVGDHPRTEVVRVRKPPAQRATLASRFACEAPMATCDQYTDECTDLRSDDAHCGTCDTRCAPAEHCSAGTCVCAPGSLVCDGTCVDPATDPTNCGQCGRSCGGGTCYGGDCLPFEVANFGHAAVHDASAVYYAANQQLRRLDKASLTDSLVTQLGLPFVYARYVAADDTKLYIAADTGTIGATNPGGIYATAKTNAGSAPSTLYDNRPDPRHIAIAHDIVVWTEDASASAQTPINLIYAAADGSGVIGSISASGLYNGSADDDVRGIAVSGSTVYWLLGDSTTGTGAIIRLDLAATPVTPSVLVELAGYPYSIAVVGTQLYVTAGWPDGKVLSLPLTGGALTVHASGLKYPAGITSAPDGSIAWTDGDGDVVIHQISPNAPHLRVIQSGYLIEHGTSVLLDNDRMFTAASGGVFVMQR